MPQHDHRRFGQSELRRRQLIGPAPGAGAAAPPVEAPAPTAPALEVPAPTAGRLVRVRARGIFPNCPRYIPGPDGTSPYTPRPGEPPVEPAWKEFESFRDAVPPRAPPPEGAADLLPYGGTAPEP